MIKDTFTPKTTLTEAMTNPAFFGDVYNAPSFWTWRTCAKLIDFIPLTEQREVDLFKECTGRTQLLNRHNRRVLRRFVFLCGRRAGKDRFLSGVAVWRAALCCDWRKYLSPGEQAVVLLLGADRKQASILKKYCRGLLETEALQREVKRQTSDVIEFKNGSVLEIATNDASLVRGRSAIAVIGSEVSHWPTDEFAINNDEEVIGGAEPSMSLCPDGGLLLLGSTVYRRSGLMYRLYSQLHGNDATDDLCWFAPSRTMNPTLRQAVIEAAEANDLHKARAEYSNIWREDSQDCYPPDAVNACTDFGVLERPPRPFISYFGFFDQAFGSGKDSFAIAIAHREGDLIIIDAIRERKPRFVPDDVIKEYSDLLKTYRVRKVVGDKAADGYRYTWQLHGIYYEPAEHSKSEIYLRFLPIVLAHRVRLIDNATLRTQLLGLERKIVGGRETVDHRSHSSAHDDVANSCAGVALLADIRQGGFTALDMGAANWGADVWNEMQKRHNQR